MRMSEAPSVDVVFVEDKTQPMQGLGEPAIGPVSAAVSNAIYDAIGVRLRDLPFTPDRIQAAQQALARTRQCVRRPRAIRPSPPTSSTSMISRLNKLVCWKYTWRFINTPDTMITSPTAHSSQPSTLRMS